MSAAASGMAPLKGKGVPARLAGRYLDLLLSGDRRGASELILSAAEQDDLDVRDIYLHVFQPVLYQVGRLWQSNRISVATEHFCTAATQFIMSQLFPRVLSAERRGRSLVACCVGGELHELGMRMVADFFEMDGWDTYYLGASAPDADVLRTVAERRADLLCVSVTMTMNVHLAGRLILGLRSDAELSRTKVMVGGFPFARNPRLSDFVGADATALDASQALKVANRLLEQDRG